MDITIVKTGAGGLKSPQLQPEVQVHTIQNGDTEWWFNGDLMVNMLIWCLSVMAMLVYKPHELWVCLP